MCLDKAYILSAQFQNQTKHCWSLNDFLIVLGNLDALRSDTASIAGQLLEEVSFVKMVSKMLHFLSVSHTYISKSISQTYSQVFKSYVINCAVVCSVCASEIICKPILTVTASRNTEF